MKDGKENPHQPLAKPMRVAANFWGEPYAHPKDPVLQTQCQEKENPTSHLLSRWGKGDLKGLCTH